MNSLVPKLALIAAVAVLAFAPMAAFATIVNFDDLPLGHLLSVPTNYAGLTWGTDGFGVWSYDYDTTYTTPHSSPNYAYNGAGQDALWIEFPEPVTLCGAYFTRTYQIDTATQVRFRDQDGNVTPWFDISDTPAYLAADFANCTKVYVDKLPSTDENPYSWYSMDDLYYNCDHEEVVPEAGSLVLAITGGLPLLGLALRRRLL